MSKHQKTAFDHARDEMFRQINHCGVLQASEEQQDEWFRDSIGYFEELFPTLSDRELGELRTLGERFCRPAIPHGKGYTEVTREKWEEEVTEEAGATA